MSDDVIDHVMGLVYKIAPVGSDARVISTKGSLFVAPAFRRETGPVLAVKGAAYIKALESAVCALVFANNTPAHAVPVFWNNDAYFMTHKIKDNTKWALDSGLPPDVVRLLAAIHFT
jgi:hypothetical protein